MGSHTCIVLLSQNFIFIAALVATTSSQDSNWRQFIARSLNCSAVCAAGRALDVTPSLGPISSNSSCVPLSVRCAFACTQNAPNCTCFNYYANGTCTFFGGPIVNVTYQQGCALWAVRIRIFINSLPLVPIYNQLPLVSI